MVDIDIDGIIACAHEILTQNTRPISYRIKRARERIQIVWFRFPSSSSCSVLITGFCCSLRAHTMNGKRNEPIENISNAFGSVEKSFRTRKFLCQTKTERKRIKQPTEPSEMHGAVHTMFHVHVHAHIHPPNNVSQHNVKKRGQRIFKSVQRFKFGRAGDSNATACNTTNPLRENTHVKCIGQKQ